MSRALKLLFFLPALAWAGEGDIRLPDGPGKDRVIGNCITCHSLDYIQMNAFLDREGWKAEVAKMRDKMGAPISDADASIILEYLGNLPGKIRPPLLKTDPNERK